MKVSLFSYVVSAALLFATTAIANNPVENDTISSKKTEGSERNVMLRMLTSLVKSRSDFPVKM